MIDSGKSNRLAIAWMEDTLVGPLQIGASEKGLSSIILMGADRFPPLAMGKDIRRNSQALRFLDQAVDQLKAYFKRSLREFDIPLDLTGQTAYTKRILMATAAIPYGSVITYGELAWQSGSPQGARAVGGAMRRNPIPIIIPCHRVLTSKHKLHGYSARPGLAAKARLLELEGLRVVDEQVLVEKSL